ncbi:MAG: transketolase C-terminal domain-containing protein, partial [Ignavibacteriaceae bacterium]
LGSMVDYSIKAIEKLSEEGINCELVNMRFAKPLDENMLDEIAEKHSKIVTLEENALIGGFGSAVLEYLNDKGCKNDILRIGLPDSFIDHGTQEELHQILGIDPNGIAEKIKIFSRNKNINHEVSI